MSDPEKVYQGVDCKRGHGGLRWISNGTCVDCNRANSGPAQKRYREKGAHAAAQRRRYRRLLDRGFCNHCGQRPLLSDSLCWECLNKKEEERALSI